MLVKIYSIIHKLILYIIYGKKISGLLYRSSINNCRGNEILSLGFFIRSQLIIKGKGNTINIMGRLVKSKIHIEGNNCKVIINSGVVIFDSEIFVRGNNADVCIGENTRIQSNCRFVCQGDNNYIDVSSNCLFSDGVALWNSDTHTIFDSTDAVVNPSKPIKIGEHVWLGSNCTILKGVSIGKDSIIGLGSVVTKSIDNNTIVAGNPARIIKKQTKWDKKYVTEVCL